MSALFFWIAFIAMLFFSVLVFSSMRFEPFTLLVSVLLWLGTIAFAWGRWIGRGMLWFGRTAAAIASIMLAMTMYSWWSRTDVFIECHRNCPPTTGSFWPLLAIWLGGAVLVSFAFWGGLLLVLSGIRKFTVRAAVWWGIPLAWTFACGYVFAKNISLDVLSVSLLSAGKFVGAVVLIIGGLALFTLPWVWHSNRQRKQAVALFRAIDWDTRQQFLSLIDTESRKIEFQLLYRPIQLPAEEPIQGGWPAQIGGNPLLLAHEGWPICEDGSPALLLLQIPLLAPRLSQLWHGRMLTVFLVDYGLLVRSNASLDLEKATAVANPLINLRVVACRLQELAVPYYCQPSDLETGGKSNSEDDDLGLSAEGLLEHSPALKERVESMTDHSTQVLSQLIAGESMISFGAEDVILVGGDPEFIQSEHDAKCPICQGSMRFLLQFNDVTNESEMGDCGVGYVYGCDVHPDQCIGFVDCF